MVKVKPLPSQETLKHLFNYDPETGSLTWKNPNPQARRLKPGDKAGSINSQGYFLVTVNSESFSVHRLIWMFVYGEDPGEFEIDHINRIRDDNRISNLRLVTHSENLQNTVAKGVYLDKRCKKFVAEIMCQGERIYLGLHNTEQEARRAYLNPKQKHHFIPNHDSLR